SSSITVDQSPTHSSGHIVANSQRTRFCLMNSATTDRAYSRRHRPNAPRCIRYGPLIAPNCGIGADGLRRRTGIGLATCSADDTMLCGATPRATRRGTPSMTLSHLPLPPSSPPPVMVPPSPRSLSTEWSGAEAEGGVDWRRVLSAVLRFKWLICRSPEDGHAADEPGPGPGAHPAGPVAGPPGLGGSPEVVRR